MASVSKPLWVQNFPSSAAMAARIMLRSIAERLVQSLVMPLLSASMVKVTGGGTTA
jgi:hypothetical protein